MDLNTVTEFLPVTDAAALRRAHDGNPATAVVAGGTWLFSVPQPHLRTLVDLTTLGWEPSTVSDAGIELAATCPVGELESVPWRPEWVAKPLVRQCVRALLASFKVRSVATVGGNVCAALPAGAVTSLAVALDGVAELWAADGGVRRLPVQEFVTGDRTTALAPGEVLRSLHLPAAALRGTTAFRRASLARLGRSATLVVGRRDPDGGLVLAVTASTPRPHVLRYREVPPPAQVAADVEEVVAGRWFDDVHGAPDWRRATTLRFAAEAVEELS
ncbi:xanthine dehydrogenase family protein subunit M [Kineococcus sp. TBRC 1896]|uniref:Xanthine dehydrogenase family protein subunit M n=1 Tax=Kineococcus mangrovi TaxID=1660183 RepID=A0ABV4HZE2_9ACTN